MGRYDKYRKAVEEETAFNNEQKMLHEKHENIKEDTVIIEKSNTVKFLLSFLKTFVKSLAGITLILLAAIGILTLLYPEIRVEFFNVLKQIYVEIKNMI